MGYASLLAAANRTDGTGSSQNSETPAIRRCSGPGKTWHQHYKILIVDDEPVTLKQLELAFEAQGFEVWPVQSGSEALKAVQTQGLPHLVLVDYLMPDMTGLECAARLTELSDVPVVVMSGRNDTDTELRVFETEADDFIAKPINVPILLARIRRILKRQGDSSPERVLRVDEHLELELGRRTARVDGTEISLSNAETKLLSLLVRNAPRVMRCEFIFDVLWPMAEVFDEAPLRALIYRTRRKIEPRPERPRYIMTQRGIGYRFPAIGTRAISISAI